MSEQTHAVADVEDIRQAYRVVLGRDADAAGLEHFAKLAQAHAWSITAVAGQLARSEEFAIRNGLELDPIEVNLGDYIVLARPSDLDIGATLLSGASYEPHVTEVVRRELEPGNTFLDVGANVGYFTMLAAHIVGPQGSVLAVEPLEKNLQLIYGAVDRNGFRHVEVMPFAASDSQRLLPMVTNLRTSNALARTTPSAKPISSYAPARPLDWMTTGLRRIDVMKIDIEGHELLALRGGRNMLDRYRPKIITEFHPHAMRAYSGVDPGEYLAELFAYARTVSVLGRGDSVKCSTAEHVMSEWAASDQQQGGRGVSHLDLLVVPD